MLPGKKTSAVLLISLFFFNSCAADYYTRIKKAENKFVNSKFENALNEVRSLYKSSGKTDQLLFLMEAGILLHTMGEYEKSNAALTDAETLLYNRGISVSSEATALLLNDRSKDYNGENFELVMIKFYIALNYIKLNDFENAKRYLRKLDYELKEMKYTDKRYKQNLAARYLDAIISEHLGKYNDSRVQYNNIAKFGGNNNSLGADRYVLAIKSADRRDMNKYAKYKNEIASYNNDIRKVSFRKEMGELVIIHESGLSAVKKSRGRLLDDKLFARSLQKALRIILMTEYKGKYSTAAILAMLSTAENPIPEYTRRTPESMYLTLSLNSQRAGNTRIYNSFSDTAISHYEDTYDRLVSSNVNRIALKVIGAYIISQATGEAVQKQNKDRALGMLASTLTAIAGGGAISATTKPDLRSWRFISSNTQLLRVFLEPGDYSVNLLPTLEGVKLTDYPEKITIGKNDLNFIIIRSLHTIK